MVFPSVETVHLFKFTFSIFLGQDHGMNERYDAFIQPASEPAFKEREVTNGAPKYGTTIMENLGIA